MRNWMSKAFQKQFNRNAPAQMEAEMQQLRTELNKYQLGWPPGHFYSPIPALDEIKKKEHKIWGNEPREIQGIDLRENEQLDLLHQLATHYKLQPWQNHKQKHLRYYFDNPNYSYGESIILFCLIMHLKPKKIIEIGSGYSSGVLLDVNELFFNRTIAHTFIEPYPQLLSSLLKPSDAADITILPTNLQDIGIETFAPLAANDILFIDSTHVSKIDSDVNHILFNILPSLNSGVYIHFHDICYPFEYPKEWVYQGRAWNEAYILRAFLQFNEKFEVALFNSFLGCFHNNLLTEKLPLAAKNAGSSIWLRKK